MGKINEETNELISELIFARLAIADVDGKAKEWHEKIEMGDRSQEDNVLSYACEVQRYSYLAGLKDGVRLILGLGVAANE